MYSTFEEQLEQDGILIYTNVGDSMMPLLRQHKDVIIIKKNTGRLKKYDVPLYKRSSGQYVLHRIIKVRKHDYVICGDNRWQLEYGITDQNIIGVLVGFIRDGKEISVTNKKYLLYVHMWCDFFIIRASILMAKHLLKKLLK
ncbi:MAG: S24/S26 family peptidase [Oscillospiraceae bacterium]